MNFSLEALIEENKGGSIKESGDNFNIDDIIKEHQTNNNNINESSNNNINVNSKSDDTSISQYSSNSLIKSSEIPNDPIEFVNYLEITLPKKEMKTNIRNFILNKELDSGNAKYKLGNLEENKELSLIMIKKNNCDITCAISHQDYIITGDIKGNINYYSISDKKRTRTIQLFKEGKHDIKSMDITEDGEIILAGFENGTVLLVDCNKGKILQTLNIHKSTVLCVRFIEKKVKTYSFFSSELNGNLNYTTADLSFSLMKFGKSSKTTVLLSDKDYPIFNIKLLNFQEKKIYKHVIFVSLSQVSLYRIEPKFKKIHSFQKPSCLNNEISNYQIPDVTFGLAKPPTTSELDEDSVESQYLMVISWGNIIQCLLVPYFSHSFQQPFPIAYFINDNSIIKIGFLSQSVIYLIDMDKLDKNYIKILNIRKFNMGEANNLENNNTNIGNNNNNEKMIGKKAEIQETIEIEGKVCNSLDLLFHKHSQKTYSNFILENSYINNSLSTYNSYNSYVPSEESSTNPKPQESTLSPTIPNDRIYSPMNLIIFSSEKIFMFSMLNFEDTIKNLQISGSWLRLFSLGIEVFDGKISALRGIPSNPEERKKKIGTFLRNIILQYIVSKITEVQNQDKSKVNLDKNVIIEETLDISIEFCIEIEAHEYLLDHLYKMFESKGYGELFLFKLEPFILCGSFKNYNFPEDLLLSLISLYSSKKRIFTLNFILINLKISSFSSKIKEKISHFSLYNPLISINIEKGNFLEPLKEMKKIIENGEGEKINECSSDDKKNYCSVLKECLLKDGIEKVMKKKGYSEYKLLWYLINSLNSLKFPLFLESLSEADFKKCVLTTIFWILNKETFIMILDIDLSKLFFILSKIFLNKNISKILEENKDDSDAKKEAKEIILGNSKDSDNAIEDISPKGLILYIRQIIESLKSKGEKIYEEALINYYLIIIRTKNNLGFSKETQMEAVTYVIKNYKLIYDKYILSEKNNEDKAVSSKTMNYSKKRICDDINSLIDSCNFDHNDIQKILTFFSVSLLDDLKFQLFSKIGKFEDAIGLLIEDNSEIHLKDYSKGKNVFDFIDWSIEKIKKEISIDNKNDNKESNDNNDNKENKDNKDNSDKKDNNNVNKDNGNDKDVKNKSDINNNNDNDNIKNNKQFIELLAFIKKNLVKMSKISLEKVHEIINKWFSNERKEILEEFKGNKEIQEKLVEMEVNRILSDTNNNKTGNEPDSFEQITESESDYIFFIFKLHIILLFEIGKKGEILKNLKRSSLYPLDELLNLCKSNNIDDATIYIYQKLGDFIEAIELSKEKFKKSFDSVVEILTYTDFSQDKSKENFLESINNTFNEFKTSFETMIEVIIKSDSEFNENNDANINNNSNRTFDKYQKIWFDALDIVYDFIKTFNNQKLMMDDDKQEYMDKFDKILSENLQDLLGKMCSYVDLTKIINVVSEKNAGVNLKEFKTLFIEMLDSFDNQSNLLLNVKKVIKCQCSSQERKLNHLFIKGNIIKSEICGVCKKALLNRNEEDKKIVSFKCGHNLHLECIKHKAAKNGNDSDDDDDNINDDISTDIACSICKEKDDESNIGLFDKCFNIKESEQNTRRRNYSIIDRRRRSKDVFKDSMNDNLGDYNTQIRFKKSFRRMKIYDESCTEKEMLFYREVTNALERELRSGIFK